MKSLLNCGGKVLDLRIPVTMGVINLTPDSFYEGSRFTNVDMCMDQIELMKNDGVKIIDLGAYSTRPGAENISEEEEKKRLLPILEMLTLRHPDLLIAVDTFRASIAEEAIQLGVSIINDISGGQFDEDLLQVVGAADVAYVLMHNRGMPSVMQDMTDYDELLMNILTYFTDRLRQLKQSGISEIIIDPGFGFAKTIQQNFSLLNNLHCLKIFSHPILVGLSRKSMIYKTLGIQADDALNGTTALHMKALFEGAKILRVHDVKEAVQTIKLYQKIQEADKYF